MEDGPAQWHDRVMLPTAPDQPDSVFRCSTFTRRVMGSIFSNPVPSQGPWDKVKKGNSLPDKVVFGPRSPVMSQMFKCKMCRKEHPLFGELGGMLDFSCENEVATQVLRYTSVSSLFRSARDSGYDMMDETIP